ncbi:Myb-DNA-bind-2 domain-containing protein [Mycena kentingensis (nom. inval.)]|nr:Myb-DNA-bind-2 domain-containing protein [Mycena kentingensis (nom. inval.)]
MAPFKDPETGLSVKFFISKDLEESIQTDLSETIAELGGRVEVKVPRAGYIIVKPNTPEEERLRLCWTSSDRPDRFFVPYTFIDACKTAGKLLKQIFLQNGVPIPMHIHSSIANLNVRQLLSQRILHSGGDPTATIHSAHVILADVHTEVWKSLVAKYQLEPNKHIEPYEWVKRCVDNGAMVHLEPVYKNPGGRKAGEERTNFSEEDESNLIRWIAEKIPFKDAGGRTGNKLYQQLVDKKDDPGYAWVTRHSWQSWRERYKKHAPRFDDRIAKIVAETKPLPGEKGQLGYVRKKEPEEKPKRTRKKRTAAEAEAGSSQTPPSSQPSADVDEEDEWAVRIGNDAPPAWAHAEAKRKASAEREAPVTKRPRTAPPPDFDPELRAISEEYKFTGEEVKDYFMNCGSIEKTKERFQRMRSMLSASFTEP